MGKEMLLAPEVVITLATMRVQTIGFALFLLVSPALPTQSAETNPVVQMVVPGFSVQELPVRLSNINNLRFSPDGRLTALGYDGRIHLLRDTDGDGLEDSAELFWAQGTIRVPVGMHWTRDGLYVSSNNKVSLLRDTDGDGKADTEEIIATGWPPTDANTQGVDATAVTLDPEGNVYFGLLVADYANAYRLKDGIPHYDLKSPRGTIQKWNRKTRQLEIIATGIRVPYTLAFNRHGDLFLTDQEGETWMPDGNPLDELNQIIPGRNYGFPPPHPQYLPNLISEPPVVAFGPQHQSTCGLVFNEPAPAGMDRPAKGLFGPAAWFGDAFVTGESRGKIWRVRLVKTPAGYVGKRFLIATLKMLTTDVAISPKGDLYVSCHSGPPDWGTGPQGEGKLFRIRFTGASEPQPIIAWAQSPTETRIAFDRPLPDSIPQALTGQEIAFGEFVRASDRFEVLKPPYQVVKFQESIARGRIRVVSAQLLGDKSLLSLSTDPHPQAVTYALTIPLANANGAHGSNFTDVAYELNGLAARWRGDRAIDSAGWDGWLPHFDSDVNAAFTAGSAWHESLKKLMLTPGKLELSSRLIFPAGKITLKLFANLPFEAAAAGKTAKAAGRETYQLEQVFSSDGGPQDITVTVASGKGLPAMHATFSTDRDPTVRPLPLKSFQLPWTVPYQSSKMPEGKSPDIAGGDWTRGRSLFTSERLKCSTCHRIRGEGTTLAPDLSNLIHRDTGSVLRDIEEPSLTINPDYVAHFIRLSNGDELTGFVRSENENLFRVTTADGKERSIKRPEVAEMRASSISLMPTGLLDGLKEEEIRDLLTFLTSDPPEPPAERPPARSRAQIERLIAPQAASEKSGKKLKCVLVASRQDHPYGQHDYPQWQSSWTRLFQASGQVDVSTAWLWPSAADFDSAKVIVFYFWNHHWTRDQYADLDRYLERGGGIVLLHASCIADSEPEELALRMGLAAQPVRTKYRHGPVKLRMVSDSNPITRGLEEIDLLDETYWPMIGDPNKVKVLATAVEEGKSWPMLWTFEKGKGRVFGSILGHFTWTLDDPLFRVIALRGMAWAAGEDSDSLVRLALSTPDSVRD